MAVPKKKISSSRRGQRRSHDGLTAATTAVCSNCGADKAPHHMCLECGMHKGKQVLKVKEAANDDSAQEVA